MGLFIEVQIDPEAADLPELVKRLVEACPVEIFERDADGRLAIVEGNVDECTLCELCLSIGKPGSVRVLKLYDDGRPLERSA